MNIEEFVRRHGIEATAEPLPRRSVGQQWHVTLTRRAHGRPKRFTQFETTLDPEPPRVDRVLLRCAEIVSALRTFEDWASFYGYDLKIPSERTLAISEFRRHGLVAERLHAFLGPRGVGDLVRIAERGEG